MGFWTLTFWMFLSTFLSLDLTNTYFFCSSKNREGFSYKTKVARTSQPKYVVNASRDHARRVYTNLGINVAMLPFLPAKE